MWKCLVKTIRNGSRGYKLWVRLSAKKSHETNISKAELSLIHRLLHKIEQIDHLQLLNLLLYTGSVTRNRSSSEQSSSPKLVPRQKSRLRATSSVNDGAFKNVEKRFVIVDEFDHPRRLSFGGPRKLSSCRSEDSVENALKRLNIWTFAKHVPL